MSMVKHVVTGARCIDFKTVVRHDRHCKHLVLLVLALCTSILWSCSSIDPRRVPVDSRSGSIGSRSASIDSRRHYLSDSAIAIIGVTAKSGLTKSFNHNLFAEELAERLSGSDRFRVLPAKGMRQFISADLYADMLKRYASNGQLSPPDIQLLMAAGLPAPRAIIARVEHDAVAKLPERREYVLSRNGAVVADREKRILSTQRTTWLSATVIDLRTGQASWARQFHAQSVADLVSNEYLGSSVSGSLASAFKNTIVNGVPTARHPSAPPMRINLDALFEELAFGLPDY